MYQFYLKIWLHYWSRFIKIYTSSLFQSINIFPMKLKCRTLTTSCKFLHHFLFYFNLTVLQRLNFQVPTIWYSVQNNLDFFNLTLTRHYNQNKCGIVLTRQEHVNFGRFLGVLKGPNFFTMVSSRRICRVSATDRICYIANIVDSNMPICPATRRL